MATSLKAGVAKAVWQARTVVVANVRVNDTHTLNEMRARLNAQNHGMKFVKNSLARKAVEDIEDRKLLGNLLHGQVFLIHSDADDGVAALRAAADLAEAYPGVALLGAAVDETLLTMEGIGAATKLPPLQDVRGDLLGALLGPSFQLASALEAPKRQIAGALAASMDKPAKDTARALEQVAGKGLAATLAGREAQLAKGDDATAAER